LKEIFQLDIDNEYVEDILILIKEWDRRGNYNNLGAAQWSLYYKNILEILSENKLKVTDSIPEKLHAEALKKSKRHLLKYFGKVDILLGDLQRHTRGEVNLPVSGLTDMIAPTYVVNSDNGRFKSVSGESYIMLVKYSKSDIEIETVLPYGNSNSKTSPHYTDQMELYINKKTKVMTLDRDEIYREAVRVYNPN
jgi:acyl-homoserine-lactone acylase